jgi:hypothetical protein
MEDNQEQAPEVVIDRNHWAQSGPDVAGFEVVNNQETAPESVAPPVVENSAETSPAVENTATASEFDSKWKEVFGDVDVNTVKEKFSQFDNVYKEYSELKSKPPVSPYKTPGIEKIDEWMSKGVKLETITRFSQLTPESLTEDEAIKLAEEIKNPQWQKRHVEADFNSKYNYTPDDLLSEEENQIRQDLVEAKKLKAAAEAKEFLQDYLGKQFNPSGVLEAEQQTKKAESEKLSSFWTSQASVLSNTKISDELKIKVSGAKGEEEIKLPFSYSVPENDLKDITAFAIETAIAAGVQPTEEGMRQVQGYINELVWAKQGKSIVNAAVQSALSEQNKAFMKMIHNPTVAGAGQVIRSQQVSDRESAWSQRLRGQKIN